MWTTPIGEGSAVDMASSAGRRRCRGPAREAGERPPAPGLRAACRDAARLVSDRFARLSRSAARPRDRALARADGPEGSPSAKATAPPRRPRPRTSGPPPVNAGCPAPCTASCPRSAAACSSAVTSSSRSSRPCNDHGSERRERQRVPGRAGEARQTRTLAHRVSAADHRRCAPRQQRHPVRAGRTRTSWGCSWWRGRTRRS